MTSATRPIIHIISTPSVCVAFCPDTMGAVALDAGLSSDLTAYLDRGPEAFSQGGYPNRIAACEQIVTNLCSGSSTGLANRLAPRLGQADPAHAIAKRSLDRLVLHVTGDCNLRCRYCYADGGSYGLPRLDMPREVAVCAINWAIMKFGGIGRIQFFGGEPLLHPRLIIEVCEYLIQLKNTGTITDCPGFGIVTNGTLGDTQVIDLLKRYDIGVTISIDGPKRVHDRLRGTGSFDKADRFALQCLQTATVKTNFECTWTSFHVDEGISVVDCMDFFFDRYGVSLLHVVPVSAPRTNRVHLTKRAASHAFKDAAAYSVRNLASGKPLSNTLSYRVLRALSEHSPIQEYCPAGYTTLSVATDGSLYPCFVLVGDERFRICKFGTEGEIRDERADLVEASIRRYNKSEHDECRQCWAAPLCSGCIGGDLIETGCVGSHSNCDIVRAVTETILLELTTS